MSTSRGFVDASTTTRCDDFPRRLTRSQRSRLIKSTRKLTKLLGENPMPSVNLPLASPISSPRKKYWEGNAAALYSPILSMTKKLARVALDHLQMGHRRDPDTKCQWENMGSIESGPATLPHGSGWSPVLVLQPESNFEPEIDGYISHVSSGMPSPSLSSLRKRPSSLFSISTSKSCLHSPPECEKWHEEREVRHRRKRFAKLARFLGERIPPDLLLPKPGSAKPSGSRGSPRRRRFLPSLVPPVPPVIPPIRAETPTSPQQGTPLSISPPCSLVDCPRPTSPSVEKIVEVFATNEPTSSSTDAAPSHPLAQAKFSSRSESSISLFHEHSTQSCTNGYFEVDDHINVVSSEDGKDPEGYPMLGSPRSESRSAFLRLRPSTSSPEPGAVSHRSERRQGWSGEWNAANMQDVISKLRDLR